ncbi:hypothetical protein JIQ42_07543 [Leishmania sp. Namibia]|uniref:hypothetical protein n=1 Tax=Leishmania sp. Namibia TaxID=2802991 RepID=UPI001B5922D6|nr:hypothetical protein JIQ42_07543 [Leishmania sp. Namibia]
MQRSLTATSGCKSASEFSLMQDDAREMRSRASMPPSLSSSSSKRAVPAALADGVGVEMDSRSQPRQLQESPMLSSSPLSSSGMCVKHALSNGRSVALSAVTSHGGEEPDEDEGQNNCSNGTVKRASRGGATSATAVTATSCASLISEGIPGSSSSASSAISPPGHSSINAVSSVYNVRSVSPGSGNGRVNGMLKSLPVFPPRVFRAAGIPPPSTETPVTTFEALMTPPAPARLSMTVTGTGHAATPLSSPTVGPTAAAATSPTSPEGAPLSNQLTCFAMGGSRRRNSISVPTSPFQADGDKAADSFMEDGVGGSGERWLVDPHHPAAPDDNSHATATVAGSVNEATTRSPQNAAHATEDNNATLHAHSVASTRASSTSPSSSSHMARSSAASPSSAAGAVASAATAAPTPTSYSVPIPPPISAASQGSKSTRNASKLSLSTEHVRHPLFIGPLPSPVVSPVARSMAGGGAGGPTSPANGGGLALSQRGSQSPSPSLRFATHDPYNTSVIVATPLMSAVPRTTSFTSYRSPSATTTPTGLGVTHMRMWSASALANGNAGGFYGGVTAADSGASFSYCAIANSDTISMKSSMADVSRGTHDGIMMGAAGGGPSKLPSPFTGEHSLCSPQCPFVGYAMPQTARYAHEEAPARMPIPYCAVGENGAEASHKGAGQQYECVQTPFEQPSCDPQYERPFQECDEQGQYMQRAKRYVPPDEQQQPEHHHCQGHVKQLLPRQQYESLWEEQHQQQLYPPPAQEAPGHYQSLEPLQRRHQQGYQSEYPHPYSEQHQHQQHDHPYPHQHEAYEYPQQYPCPQTSERQGLYAHQAHAELPQHHRHSMPPPQEPQYQPQQTLHPYAPPHQQQYNHQRQQPPQPPHRTQKLYGERSGNAGAAHHNSSGPRKRTAQDVLPGFFSVDTIQLGDQTHLVSDRNGVPHEHNEQPPFGTRASQDAALLAGGSCLDHTPPQYQTSHGSCGPSAAPELDIRGSSPALTAMPTPSASRQQPQQLSRSLSVHYDAATARGAPGDYYGGSRAGAELAAAVPSASSHGSDDGEAVRMHDGAMYDPQPPHAERQLGNASVVTVGGMVVAQPPHMEAPAVSRTSNPRTGYAPAYQGGSSGGGNTNISRVTGSGSSGPSNKSMLLNSTVSGCIANVEPNESGSCSSANGGGGVSMTHVYNVDSSIDVCGSPGAPASTLPSARPSAQVGVCSGSGYTGASATTATVVYGAYSHYPSTSNYAMGPTEVHISQPERHPTGSTAAMSSSLEGANESRSTTNVPFAPPLPRSAVAMDGGGGAKRQPSHGEDARLQASLNTRQHQRRHPGASGNAADESQPINGGEVCSPHIALPNRRRLFIPSVNQPSEYDDMRCPPPPPSQMLPHAQQQQFRITSEGSNSSNNIGSTQANAARGTGAMGVTTGQGPSLSGAPSENQDAGKAAAALLFCPSEGCPMEPSRAPWEKVEVVRAIPRTMEPSTQMWGSGAPATQRRRHPKKKR